MIVNNLFLDIAIDEIDMDEMVKDLEKISYQVKHLSGTIDDFRDFFKESKEKNSMTIKEGYGSYDDYHRKTTLKP